MKKFFFLQHCAWFWNRNTSHNFEFDKKMYQQRPQSIIWIQWVYSRIVWTQRTPKAWVYLEGSGGMIPWKIFKFWASEITCLFSSPQHVDGRWTCAGFLSLSICTGRIFISQIQPTTPLSEVKWLTSSKLLCCWPVSWCFWGKVRNNSKFLKRTGEEGPPPQGRSSIAKMIFMLDWVGLSWFVAKSLNYTVNRGWFDALTCLQRDHCYEHYQPVLDENLRCCSSHLWAYHLGYLHSHHSNRVAAAIPETLIVYQVNGNYGIQGFHRCSIVQCRCPSLRCHVTSHRF